MKENRRLLKLSVISLVHYWKLVFRSLLFVFALAMYVVCKVRNIRTPFENAETESVILIVVCVIFTVEMILRFFPSKTESMGCQKQFSKNYMEYDELHAPAITAQTNPSGWRTFFCAIVWLVLNGMLGLLYFLGVYDAGVLVLISLAYAVCDMICILFFCPFQTWILKNKCCTTCRIYNWDYAMMCTPLVFIPNVWTLSLVGMSLLLLLRWEITYRLHPERFAESSNRCLSCANCKEKLCHHKKQLRHYLKVQYAKLRKLQAAAIKLVDKSVKNTSANGIKQDTESERACISKEKNDGISESTASEESHPTEHECENRSK